MNSGFSGRFKRPAPNREEREACWAARNAFWDCIKKAYADGRPVPEELEDTISISECQALRKTYSAACPESWTKLFNLQNDTRLFGEMEANLGARDA